MFKFYLFQEHIAVYTKACNNLQALFIMKKNCSISGQSQSDAKFAIKRMFWNGFPSKTH